MPAPFVIVPSGADPGNGCAVWSNARRVDCATALGEEERRAQVVVVSRIRLPTLLCVSRGSDHSTFIAPSGRQKAETAPHDQIQRLGFRQVGHEPVNRAASDPFTPFPWRRPFCPSCGERGCGPSGPRRKASTGPRTASSWDLRSSFAAQELGRLRFQFQDLGSYHPTFSLQRGELQPIPVGVGLLVSKVRVGVNVGGIAQRLEDLAVVGGDPMGFLSGKQTPPVPRGSLPAMLVGVAAAQLLDAVRLDRVLDRIVRCGLQPIADAVNSRTGSRTRRS